MDNSSTFAPYAAPENVTRILERARKGGVKRVDAEFLITIGIGEGMIPRALRALQFLDFINPDGSFTQRFERYVVGSEDDARSVLVEAIHASYEVIFRAINPATDGRDKVHTAFRTREPSGQWGRMVTFFLGICKAAGMDVLEPPSDRPGRDSGSKERATARRTTVPPKRTIHPPQPPPQNPPGYKSLALDPALAGIVAKLAELETSDDLERWWAMFKAAFYFVKKIES